MRLMKYLQSILFTLVVLLAFTLAEAPASNKASIQIPLRTQRDYYRNGQRDEETWSSTPRIVYRVNGPITAGSQLSVSFTLPSGKPWVTLNCSTNETKEGYWWETECGMNTSEFKDEQATIE